MDGIGTIIGAGSSTTSLNEWAKDKPLSILQLDPADRAVLRIADERDAIQKKTFTKWVNKHLKKSGRHINDLFEDLRDGHNLISLLEVLSGELLPRERGKLRFHMLQNVQVALDFLKFRKIKLVNIRAEDIVDGNPKLTLGLIWTIILLFQISDIIHHGENVDISAKEALLQWSRRMTDKYPGVRVRDFTSSWRDGLAFNAILHRNRPDLIDFRNLRKRSARDNLDSAFNIAEREFGVTRLLDAEDVDTPQPDEKSLITYISSLYDVFPEPPPMPPLVDRETLQKIENYKDLAASLYVWIRDNTQMLMDRSFPNNLVELKSLLADCNRFRMDEVPPKLKQKQRVVQMYREIVKSLSEDDVFDLDDELKGDSIERDWNRLINALQERDRAISDEMTRLERLQRLAERVHREAKQCETRLDDIEKRIDEEERRIDRLHPMDAKKNCDRIEQELKSCEDVIKSMFNDVQTLKDGKYHQAPELSRRVQKLHDRWSSLHMNFQNRLLSKLSTRSFTTEEKKVTRERRTVLETRLVDTNEAFAFLQECLTWVTNKLKSIEEADFGNDLPSIQSHLQQHQDEHKLIDQFSRNIDQCLAQKNNFTGEENTLYTQMLHKLQKTYSELLVLSNKRLSDLETLLEFIKSATDELIWLNEKEESELARDWSSKNLNVLEVEQYYETLMQDLEHREPRFNRVVEHGENLILQGHSASKCVEAYLAAMRTQWSWILQLTVCLETHIKYASAYHQFFREASECEHWLNRQEETLNSVFSRTDFSLDDGERLLRDMQDLKNDLNRYGEIVATLSRRSKEIVPLKDRHRPVTRSTKITAICSYKQPSINISKGDQCTLHDNSQKIKWKVTTKTGVDGHVPAVCFVLPPPNQEAIQTAEKLKRLLERILALWTKRQRRMRQNMIFATIKVVRSWDLNQFMAMEPSQREAIWKALNDDANKLIQEGPSDDPGLRRLREEMKKCNDQFAELQKKAQKAQAQKSSPKSVSPTRELTPQYLSNLEIKLNDASHTLDMRCQSSIPRDIDAVESLVVQHKSFETDVRQLEPQIATVEKSLKSSPRKPTNARCESILQKWRDIWSTSNIYVERLKLVEIALGHLDNINSVVAELELKLASYESLPCNLGQLKLVHESLLELQPALHRHQPAVDRLNDTVSKLRSVVDRSRPGKTRHSDVDKLESDTQKLNIRWSNVGTQLVERLRSCEASSELLNQYKSSLSTEKLFLSQIEVKLDKLKPVKNLSPKQVLSEVETGMAIYHSLAGHQSNIEHVNTEGGRYVREAKIYDMRVKHYRESLEDVHPSLDASMSKKKAKVQQAGADVIAAEVDALNEQYTSLVNHVLQRLHQLLDVAPKEHVSKIRMIIQEAVPMNIHTFHQEFSIVPRDVIDGSNAELLESYGETRRTTTYSSSRSVQHSVFTTAEEMDVDHKLDNRTSTASLTLTFKEEPTVVTQHKVKTIVDHRHSRSKDKTEFVQEIRDTSPVQGASMTFTELRSSRKIEQVEEGIGTEPWWRLKGVKNLKTDNWVTLADGIRSNIIIVSSTEYVDLRNGKKMSIPEAVARGYVDSTLWEKLQQLCGIIDPKTGRELTLWEAIQRGLFDPERGCFIDPRTGRPLTAEEAMKLSLFLQEKDLQLTLVEFVRAATLIDPDAGKFTLKSGDSVTLNEAFANGVVSVKCLNNDVGLCLTDAVQQGLVNVTSGQFVDHNLGEQFKLDDAVVRQFLSGNYVTEVVDTRTYDRLTLNSALQMGIIDSNTGRFMDKDKLKILKFDEAIHQGFLGKPLTLKDAHKLGYLANNGDVIDPLTGTVYTFLVAIGKGFLDINVRSILSPESRELLTIPEALMKGLIAPRGLYCNPLNGDLLPIGEAVNNGWISSVTQKRIYDVEGFKDVIDGNYLTFNVAVNKGIIRLSTGTILDKTTQNQLSFTEAASKGLIQPQIVTIFSKKIGIFDPILKAYELNLWEATWKGFISPKTGDILEPKTQLPVQFNDAIQQRFITPEGAALLRSFLNITVSVATITTHVTRKVMVTHEEEEDFVPDDHDGDVTEVRRKSSSLKTPKVVSISEPSNNEFEDVSNEDQDFTTIEVRSTLRQGDISDSKTLKTVVINEPSTAKNSGVTTEIKGVITKFKGTAEIKGVSIEVKGVPNEVKGVPTEVKGVRTEVKGVSIEVKGVPTEVKGVPNSKFRPTLHQGIVVDLKKEMSPNVMVPSTSKKQGVTTVVPTKVKGVPTTPIRPSLRQGTVTDSKTTKAKVSSIKQQDVTNTDVRRTSSSQDETKIQKVVSLRDPDVKYQGVTTDGQHVITTEVKRTLHQGVNVSQTQKTFDLNDPCTVEYQDVSSEDRDLRVVEVRRTLRQEGSDPIIQKTVVFKDPSATGYRGVTTTEVRHSFRQGVDDPRTQNTVTTEDQGVTITEIRRNLPHGVITDSKTPRTFGFNDPSMIEHQDQSTTEVSRTSRHGVSDPGVLKTPTTIEYKDVTIDDQGMDTTDDRRTFGVNERQILKDPSTIECQDVTIEDQGITTTEVRRTLHPKTQITFSLNDPSTIEYQDFTSEDQGVGNIEVKRQGVHDPDIQRTISLRDQDVNTDGQDVTTTHVRRVVRQGVIVSQTQKTFSLNDPSTAEYQDVSSGDRDLGTNEVRRIVRPEVSDPEIRNQNVRGQYQGVTADSQNMTTEVRRTLRQGVVVSETQRTFVLNDPSITELEDQEVETIEVKRPLGVPKTVSSKDPSTDGQDVTTTTTEVRHVVRQGVVSKTQRTLGLNELCTIEYQELSPENQGSPTTVISRTRHSDSTPKTPMSLEAVIRHGIYNPSTGIITDPVSNKPLSLEEAVQRKLIDAEITEIKDSKTNCFISLKDAIKSNFFIDKSGIKMKDKRSQGEFVPLDVALDRHLIVTNRPSMTLIDAINRGFYCGVSRLFTDVANDSNVTLNEALDSKLIDVDSALIKDDRTNTLVTLKDGLDFGLIDGEKGIICHPEDITLDAALKMGYIVRSKPPFTLQEALERGFYDATSGLMIRFDTNEKETLEESIKQGWIDGYTLTVKDHRSNNILTLIEAIDVSIVDAKMGIIVDSISGAEMSFYDALDAGFLIPSRNKLSLPEAINKGLYNPKNGLFLNHTTCETMTLSRAIQSGLIDPETTMICDPGREFPIPFYEAVKEGIVDTVSGTIKTTSLIKRVDFVIAMDMGLLMEVRKPLIIRDALKKGLYDSNTGLFIDPCSGKKLTLIEAIEIKLLDFESVHVKDTRSGFWKKVNLKQAIDFGLVDGLTGLVINVDGSQTTLEKSFELGLIMDSRRSISIQKAIHQGLYDENTGRFTDPNTGRKITLHEAIRRSILNIDLPCYWSVVDCRLWSLIETVRGGIINRTDGRFIEPITHEVVSLLEALERGWIVDIERPFGLYEAITVGLYDKLTGHFVHPTNGRKLNLNESLMESLIETSTSIVRHSKTNRFVLLPEAISSNLIDPVQGVYCVPGDKVRFTLDVAVEKGLIVTARRPLTLDEIVVKMHLYNKKTGEIVDPLVGDCLSVARALKVGFLDGTTTIIKGSKGSSKSLKQAISDKEVDPLKGTVVDLKTKKSVTFDVAFQKTIFVSVERPITFNKAIRKGSIDLIKGTFIDPRTLHESTLQEAVINELIDPDSAVVKDPKSGRFKTLKNAMEEGLIDMDRRALVDRDTGKIRTLVIMFDQGTVVFLREPVSFDTALDTELLDIVTGRFTDRTSTNEMIVTLKEALEIGLVDRQSVLLKDPANKRLLKLDEAYDENLMQPERGTVLSTGENIFVTIGDALERGLFVTPRRPLSFIEMIEYGVYDSMTGHITDVFNKTITMTLQEAIDATIVDTTTTMIRHPKTGRMLTVNEAIVECILDSVTGRLMIQVDDTTETLTLTEAQRRGLLSTAEARLAVQEKYKLCDETITKLLSWIGSVEKSLAEQSPVRETSNELRDQINNLKNIKNDLDDHQRPVSSCIDQVQMVVTRGQDVLSTDEIQQLQKNGRELHRRYDASVTQCDDLLRKLSSAFDELQKLKNDLEPFVVWLRRAEQELVEKERLLLNVNKMKDSTKSMKEFVSDVITHQADLRFITMAAHRFLDESKEYLRTLNTFRTNLPRRYPHIEPHESEVKRQVTEVTVAFQDLLNRASKLGDRFSSVTDKQKQFADAVDKARVWLNEAKELTRRLLNEPVSGEPRAIQDQLDKTKTLHMDIVTQGRLIETAKQTAKSLLDALGPDASNAELDVIESTIDDLDGQYNRLVQMVSDRTQELETALVHSQGVQDGIDGLLQWLNDIENQSRVQQKPASLIRERLDEQIREHRLLQADVDGHKPSVHGVTSSAEELLRSGGNARIAKRIETKLRELTTRFEKLSERSQKRGELLDDTSASLETFTVSTVRLDNWLDSVRERIEPAELAKLGMQECSMRIDAVLKEKERKRDDFEELVRQGKTLVAKKDVTDTQVIKDKIKNLEQQWKELGDGLLDKQKQLQARTDQLSSYETLRDQVFQWLSQMETRVDSLQSVALDVPFIRRQQDELKPISREYNDYSSTITKVTELGNSYDALTRGERPDSPRRRVPTGGSLPKKVVISPTRKSPTRAPKSPEGTRSPSPTKSGGSSSPFGFTPGAQSPTSAVSSGFSSRRNSQDYVHLEDLSPVQQQLSEINHRYNMLGVRLTDRQHEIERILEELKRHIESHKNLTQFVSDKERQLPRYTIPATKEATDKQLTVVKTILEEIQSNQSQLDSLKSQTNELLKRKSDAYGADDLQQLITDLVARWNNLLRNCREAIEFLEDAKLFHDEHDHLQGFLTQKDKMMSVLGPIASEPRLVANQKEQVEVLRDEFKSQAPHLETLNHAGELLLDRVDVNSPDARDVDKKLAAVNKAWQNLLSRLNDREDCLEKATDAAKDFQDGINNLQATLQRISDEFDNISDAGDVEDKLRKLNNLEKDLEDQRPVLADVEALGEQLSDILSDQASKNEIKNKLNGVEKTYNNLHRKIDNRQAELESLLREGKEFDNSCENIQRWLQDMWTTVRQELKISADWEILKQQVQDYEPIYREVSSKEHEVHMLLNKGKDAVLKLIKANDRQSLQRKLDNIKDQWEKLRKEAVDKHTRLQSCNEHCRKFHSALNRFLPWLQIAEEKLESFEPVSLHKLELEKQIKEIQSFKNDLSKHSQEYESLRSLGDMLVKACDIDREIIRDQLDDVKRRWDRLNDATLERTQGLETVAKKLAEFTEELRDVQHGVKRCEDWLGSHDEDATRDPKLLERLKPLLKDAEALRGQIAHLRIKAKEVTSAASPDTDTAHIHEQVDALEDRCNRLADALNDRCSGLETASQLLTKYNDKVKGVHHDLSSLEDQLDHMGPIARDVDTVKKQIYEVKSFLDAVDHKKNDIGNLDRDCKEIVSHGYSSDVKGCKTQVENLKKQLTKLEDRGRTRETDLDAMLVKLVKFDDDYDDVTSNIDNVSREERNFKPIGGDVDTIRVQQKEFKKFNKDNVEPLSKKVDKINRSGQGLVQSAATGVNTSWLESRLEKLNDRWNDLKQKLNDRERRLDVALLQSGTFQEAMTGLLHWLSDTEDMVANQKPPSSDYKVVKAQLQEQKFLNKMLLDRQNSVSSLLDMGKEIAANMDGAERDAVERQLGDMVERYDALTNAAQDRMEVLEKAMKVAKEFQDKMTPLSEWLDRMERKLSAMETIPTDEAKVRRLIADHESLHDDILDKKPSFDELADIAQTLMPLVGDDEAQALADKLQELTDRYAKLVDDSEALGHFLRSSVESLNMFTLNLDDVLHWVGEMESRLNRYKVLSVFIDKLQEQLDELTDLTEEIADHQKQVDELITNGHELMRRVTGDDAIIVKEKLDTLQHRFGDLTGKAADLLGRAHAALPLVEQFHVSHHRLCDWMLGAESQLSSIEASGLDIQEREIERLETEIAQHRPLVEQINIVGPQLCQISPGEGAATIEGLVSRDNRRFDAICERVQRRAERIQLSKQRNSEVIGDLDELLDWFRDAERQLAEAEPISSDADHLRLLLKEQRALNDDINSQKGRVRDVLAAAKRLMRDTSPNDDMSALREKVDDLKETMEGVCQMSADRLNALEQALPLAEHFYDTHSDLVNWLDEAETAATTEMDAPLVNAHQIRKQQEKNKALLQSLNDHKPLIDKLNKTGHALVKLCDEDEGVKVQEIMDSDNGRFVALRDILRERQNALEEALQMSSQFADKLDGLLSALGNTADQVNNAEPISAHPPKIHEQIVENQSIVDDLDKRSPAFEAIKRAASEVIDKAGDSRDQAVKDIKQKLDRLNNLWDGIQNATKNREKSLEDALAMAEKFWDELHNVMTALKDLQNSLNAQEPPGVEPSAIQHQQDALHELEHEIRQTEPEVEQCRRTGHDLMKLCGEPDKPEVKKHIEDLDHAWENITALYARREENLIDAMEKAMAFHDTLQNILEFLDSAEETFANLGPLGSDIESVKGQIKQLKDFKADVDPHMVEVEALNRQAQRLTENTSPDQATAIKEPLSDVNHRWDDLLKGIVDRQRQLEHALLKLGQFQHALDELFVWMTKTEKTLDELKPVFGDPQVIEVELAKLKVVVNDIHAHQSSVDTLNDAGRQLIEQDKGSEDASAMQKKLTLLNTRWHALQKKAADRTKELQEALKEAQAFNQDIQDLLTWLNDADAMLSTSKPVGGLPETAREQLQRFMEIYDELDANRPRVESVLQQGTAHLKRSNEGAAKNLQQNLKVLRQKWDSVLNRANDKKIKLEIALREATEFHEALQAFVEWLTDSEKYLANLKPVSRVLPVIQEQIEEHKNFQKDIGAHRETMLNLDKKGTHLKYFSQKQDVILIKNLLISVQHRWERVVSKSAERTRQLDHGFKEAKEFHDSWTDLCKWLDNSERMLDELIGQMSQEPSRIKQLLAKHKEFQRTLAGKQPTYDATMKAGRLLREKSSKTDQPVIQDMLNELKNKWNSVCSKSVDRQRKLEEGLLFSGQFKDAMQALLDWLDKVKKDLGENQPVHGDLDTVNALVEKHKAFTEELKNRKANMESVKRTATDLLKTASKEDALSIETQITELTSKWDEVSRLTDLRKRRLEEALKQAEELHKAVHLLLEWLSDAEMKLRFAGPLPDDEATTRLQIEEHRRFLREMADKERDKESTISLAEEILRKCHPDAASVIKHWITIIQSRWEEVSVWARQREQRLQDHLDSLRDMSALIDELLEYLNRIERTLLRLEDEPLPDDIPIVERLIDEHQQLMDDLTSRQKDVERVTKTKKPPPLAQPKGTPASALKSPRDGSKSPRLATPSAKTQTLDRKTPKTSTPLKSKTTAPSPTAMKNPRAKEVSDKWRSVWLLALERQRRLQEKLKHLQEVEKMRDFSWDEWRKRFLRFMKNKKSRIMDFFRKMDKDNDGKLTREEFTVGILKSGFPTSRLELNAVADMFDHGDGFIDIKEFVDALRPEREGSRPLTDAEVIEDEVQKQVMLCTCATRFKVKQVGEGKYRFGESQKLRLVRILRSTVMVRVGGGWVALDEFLVKNDPCRGSLPIMISPIRPIYEEHEFGCPLAATTTTAAGAASSLHRKLSKGRTNLELREQFILATGVSQSIMPFKSKSANSSMSSQSRLPGSTGSVQTAGPITKKAPATDNPNNNGYSGGSCPSTLFPPMTTTTDESVFDPHNVMTPRLFATTCNPYTGERSPPVSPPNVTDSKIPVYRRRINIREKSVRSAPMSRSRGAAVSDSSNQSGRTSNLSGSLLSPTGSGMGNRTGSRPSSRPSSRGPSRAGSNLSLDSVDGVPPSPSTGRRTPGLGSNLKRHPSNVSQSSLTGSTPSKIPTSSRRTAATANGGVKGETKTRFK